MILFLYITSLFAHSDYPVHILPDSPGYVYQHLGLGFEKQNSPIIRNAIDAGNKNLNWLKHMNALRDSENQIRLTKPGELTSYPIASPSIYNEEIVGQRQNEILASIPSSMKAIIYGTAPFTNDPGMPIEDYIFWAKKIDRVYQSANRWVSMLPHRAYYESNAKNDVRGYYFLTKEENLQTKLSQFASLSTDEQTRLKSHLTGMCRNNNLQSRQSCETSFVQAQRQNQVWGFYQKHLTTSKKLWNSYFKINGFRTDIAWNASNPNVATLPVRDTAAHIEDFITYNVEDEWKWDTWNLRLDFRPQARVHVLFQPNVTPHVTGGGDRVVMDENTPLTEWDVMWTIRHEFGHVLGFKDCYVEFYDSDLKAMVNYQLDVTDMMCSRAGVMQEKHYNEMKSAYFNK